MKSGLKKVGERLKELREAVSKTQDELARDLTSASTSTKFSREKINMWEQGERNMKIGDCELLADYFNVTCDYIIRGIPSDKVDIAKTLGLTPDAIDALISEKNGDGYFSDRSRLLSEIIASERFRNDCCEAYHAMSGGIRFTIARLFNNKGWDIFDLLCSNADCDANKLEELRETCINGALLKATRALIDVIESYNGREAVERNDNDFEDNEPFLGGEPNAPQD